MFSRLYQTQLDRVTVTGVLTELIIALNPLAAVIWIGGLVYYSRPKWHNTLTALKEVYDSLPPAGEMPATVIAFTNDEAGIDFFQGFFGTVVPVKKVFNPYAMFDKDSWQTIYICKDAKENFAGMKEAFKARVFE